MINGIMNIASMVFGLVMVVFCKVFAKATSDFYYNLFHRRFSEKGYQIAFLIAGIAFIIFGFLSIFGIIKPK